jgi:hypothetical protein
MATTRRNFGVAFWRRCSPIFRWRSAGQALNTLSVSWPIQPIEDSAMKTRAVLIFCAIGLVPIALGYGAIACSQFGRPFRHYR